MTPIILEPSHWLPAQFGTKLNTSSHLSLLFAQGILLDCSAYPEYCRLTLSLQYTLPFFSRLPSASFEGGSYVEKNKKKLARTGSYYVTMTSIELRVAHGGSDVLACRPLNEGQNCEEVINLPIRAFYLYNFSRLRQWTNFKAI